jgi:hypothetical protein
MPRHFLGSLILILLLFGLLYTRPAWAESNGEETGQVFVRVSPLTLLLENNVTIKVGDFTCELAQGIDTSSVCEDLPPGDYEVTATSEGYIVVPPSYQLTVPGDPEESEDEDRDEEESDKEDSGDSPDAANLNGDFFFRFYQIRNELYMPTVQVQP